MNITFIRCKKRDVYKVYHLALRIQVFNMNSFWMNKKQSHSSAALDITGYFKMSETN